MISLLISTAGSVIGTLIVGPVKWMWSKIRGRPTPEAHERSVAAGRDISGQVAAGDQSTVAGQAGVVMGAGSTTHIQQGLSAEDHDRLVRIEGKLDQWGEHAAPPGASTPDTSALAAADVTERTESLLAEAVELQRQNKERQAIDCLLEAYRRDLPPIAKAELHLLAGNGFARLSELEQAEAHYLRSLAAAEEASDDGGRAAALGNLGNIYADRGLMDKAEHYYKRALVIDEEIEDHVGVANALGNLGAVHHRRDELDEAEDCYKRALVIQEEIEDRLGQANAIGNLGIVYRERGELQKAEEHHMKALAIHRELRHYGGEAIDLCGLGNLCADKGDLDKAEEYHQRALAIDEQLDNRLGRAEDLGNLGSVYVLRGNMDRAREHYQNALALFEQIGAQPQVARTRELLEGLRTPNP